MSDRLFDMDDVPEVPLFREPPPGRGALVMDERIEHDYPPEWRKCLTCGGAGYDLDLMPDARRLELVAEKPKAIAALLRREFECRACLGMGSVKAMVRLLAGHRCERCHHPYMPKGDARMLGCEPTPHVWSPCDEKCEHGGPYRIVGTDEPLMETSYPANDYATELGVDLEAFWRILTVHHLDGDKANLAWWNLAALCQRCHLQIQAKVVMERVYPHEHSEWFKPHAAGWYAKTYLNEDVTHLEALDRMDELLALERLT